MPVRKNGYYADPALGTAFDNLADAFKAPSGADLAGYANAGATREKAARLSDLYNYARDPNFTQEQADRLGIAAGNYAPSQSYYSVDEGNDTTRRNADVAAKTTTDVANINNAGALARQFALPVSAADGVTVRLPAQTAAATGLPDMFRGQVTANQGQTVTLPGGETIKGTPIAPTDSQVIGAITGKLGPEDQRAIATKGVSVVPIAGKDGEPTNVLPIDAQNKTPYTADTTTRQLGTYKTAAGEGNVYYDRDKNKWIDSQTGVELPPGVPVKSLSPGTQVNIETKAPSKIEDAYGEGVGAQIKMTLDNAGAAPRNLAEIAQFRDALSRAGDNITTGPLSSYALKGKQAIGGLLGTTLEGVPEAELINNIGFKLATQASKAISSRPTQMEFGKALEIKPGLALSKPGMIATLGIMEQNARDDQALATLASDPANRQNWTATVQKYYAEHPIMSPFNPGQPLGQADIATLEAAAPAGGAAPAASATPAATAGPPAGAVALLKGKPDMAAAFDAKYGAGAASRALGAQ